MDNNSSLKKIDFIIEDLEHFSNKESLYDHWINGVGPGYNENTLSWTDGYPYFKELVKNKEIALTKDQVKAILKIDIMINTFDRILNRGDTPENWVDFHLYILNHPYWIKIMNQAQYALSLLKK